MLNWRNIANLKVFKSLTFKADAMIRSKTISGVGVERNASTLMAARVVTLVDDHIIQPDENGTRYILNNTGNIVVDLPLPEVGFEFWFYVGPTEPTGTQHKVRTSGNANIMVGVICSAEDAAGSTTVIQAADDVNFKGNAAVHGDYAHVWCDGSYYYVDAMCAVQDGIFLAT